MSMVYSLRGASGGPVKIGYSNYFCWKGRIQDHQSSHWDNLITLSILEIPSSMIVHETFGLHIESLMHSFFAARRINYREWFDITPEENAFACEQLEGLYSRDMLIYHRQSIYADKPSELYSVIRADIPLHPIALSRLHEP